MARRCNSIKPYYTLISNCITNMEELFNLYDSLKGKDRLTDREDEIWCNILLTFELIYRNLDKEKDCFLQNFDFKVIKEK